MTRLSPIILLCCLFIPLSVSGASTDPNTGDVDPARSALTKGEYPWYDSANDRVMAVDLAPEKDSSWLRSFGNWIERVFSTIGDFFARIARALKLPEIGSLGNVTPIVLTGIGIVLLVILLRVLWASASFDRGQDGVPGRTVGRTSRITMLPGEMGASPVADPWAEAVERQRRGDYSGAIIFLFAHQLLELDRFGLIRLTPGGTGRKYVRGLADARLQELLSATLGLFEQAYYGHKRLSSTSFEPVWAGAQSFQSHLVSLEKQTS